MTDDPLVWRVLDANVNRTAEGLRVAEDWLRLVQSNGPLARRCKELRHRLAEIARTLPEGALIRHRDADQDVGRPTFGAGERVRQGPAEVAQAAWKRVQQSLRCLEEYGKVVSPELGEAFKGLRYAVYELERASELAHRASHEVGTAPLCVLLDARRSESEFRSIAEQLVAVQVPWIQLRAKELDDRQWLGRAWSLRELTECSTTRMIVNDRADIAKLVCADGLHLGQDDLAVQDARRLVHASCWIGVSTHSLSQAQQAVRDGATYLGAGPTFPSSTKTFREFSGTEYLRQIAAEIALPTFAIGGITLERLPEVLETGVSRVAVQGAIVNAREPGSAAREFLEILAAYTGKTPPLQES